MATAINEAHSLIEQGIKKVKQGGKMVSEGNWLISDGALVAAPIGKDGAHNDSTSVLVDISQEADVEYETLRAFRRIAAAWPKKERHPRTTFSVHQVFASVENRFWLIKNPSEQHARVDKETGELIWTVAGARLYLGKKPQYSSDKLPKTAFEHVHEAISHLHQAREMFASYTEWRDDEELVATATTVCDDAVTLANEIKQRIEYLLNDDEFSKITRALKVVK